ncbi:DnaT-like ssDNA-binding protein [Janthinobacterium sp. J1-1]|uniref:DnaT-like ssDNA-binding protein n=1 Tax=Janthinobacterium sp. J1-1 TaxID=3065910 RepID=UPI0028114093|nr:DnaT-like ssDNA-binding protein [Janthinobacterium sp. J1-1]
MAITIETGAGLADAESYASVAAADARCVSLGLTAWAVLDEGAKEIALRRAAQFMATYRTRWAGRRVYQRQALDWPRYNVVVDGFILPSTSVPLDVVNACIDLAVRAGSGEELLPDLDTGSNAIKKDKTGPLETEYFQNTTDARERFVAVDALLAPYFGSSGGGNSMKVTRA